MQTKVNKFMESVFCSVGLHWWGPWNVDNNRWCVNCDTRQHKVY